MQKDIFIAGTDTGVGKTVVTAAILHALQKQGKTTIGMKPIASGCQVTPGGLRNEDAECLIQHSSIEMPYSVVNPFAFEPAIAPHLAAQISQTDIDLQVIDEHYQTISAACDHAIVEGVGGWLVPINSRYNMADLVRLLDLRVVLVVGMRLGCINHALLSYQAIVDCGLYCEGWVANIIDSDMDYVGENIIAIRSRINAPLIGMLAYSKNLSIPKISESLDIHRLI